MPEPNEADQGSQIEESANTPAETPPDQQTIAKQSDEAPSPYKGMMDHLDIPVELQARLAPKAAKPQDEAETPEPPVPAEAPEEIPTDPEVDEEDAEPEEVEELKPAAGQKPDKVQKRINRLTRQKSELADQLDRVAIENQRLRQELTQGKDAEPQLPPLSGGGLPQIQAELDKCDAMLQWCDENSEGGEIGEGDNAKYYDAATVKAWRRSAETSRQERVVEKRDELNRLKQVRERADTDAFALWPEMFDKRNPEFQEAVALLKQYPFLQAIPEANFVIGVFLEGRKKTKEKISVTRNGKPAKAHRDLDERVLSTPRVPLAPHSPEPPTRESTPSSTKAYNEAMSRLVDDPDGSAPNLAAAFAALEKVKRLQPAGRSLVRS